MITWSESQQMVRDVVRKFVEAEIAPKVDELEHGDLPPYDILRKLFKTFGMDEMARQRFKQQMAKEKKAAAGEAVAEEKAARSENADAVAMQMIPIIEICRYCPGIVTAMGVSMGLTASAVLSKGTTAQKER